jgi:hypothetical protein
MATLLEYPTLSQSHGQPYEQRLAIGVWDRGETRRWRWVGYHGMVKVKFMDCFRRWGFPRILPSEINIRPRLRDSASSPSSPQTTNHNLLSRQLPGLRELYEMRKYTSSLTPCPRHLGEWARPRPTRLIFCSCARESAG